MAGAAVLLEEWLQELAALAQVNLNPLSSSKNQCFPSQEHSVLHQQELLLAR